MDTMRRCRVVSRRWAVVASAIVIAGFGAGLQVVPWAAASTSSGDRAIFEPLIPARIMDTRTPSPVPLTAGPDRPLNVSGVAGVPLDATAVALNVTAVQPTAAGYLAVYPADAALPTVSSVNFVPGQIVANAVVVKLGSTGASGGRIRIFNSGGETHVIVDVAGFFRGHDHDDRYYTKVQTQARLAGNSLSCGAQFLKSVAADGTPTCGAGATGPTGPTGPPGPAGPKGFASASPVNLPASGSEFFRILTDTFVVPGGVTSCVVTSSVQAQPSASAANDFVYLRNAVVRDGTNGQDGVYGQYLTNDGTGRKQPSVTRTSVLTVAPGQTVGFGVYFGGLSGTWYGAPFAQTTSYLCS
jgi:hypothetical protein